MTRRERAQSRIDPDLMRAINAAAEQSAERAAKRALRAQKEMTKEAIYETLAALGFRTDTHEARQEIALDTRFLRKIRIAAETNPGRYGFVIFTALVTVAGALLTYAIQQLLAPLFSR